MAAAAASWRIQKVLGASAWAAQGIRASAAGSRLIQDATLMAAAAAASWRIQTVLGASAAATQDIRITRLGTSSAVGSRLIVSRDLLRRRTVFGLPHPIYFRLHGRPVSASSTPDKNGSVGHRRAVAKQLNVPKGSLPESLVDSKSLKDLKYRILTLENVCNFYKKFQWLLLAPTVVALLMTVPSAIDIVHGVSTVKKGQKNTAEEMSNLNKRIEYLEGRIK